MKIVHLCLAGPFNDGWTYQENMLVLHHRRAGHDVAVIAMPFTTSTESGALGDYRPGRYTDSDGVDVIRVPLLFPGSRPSRSRFNVFAGVSRELAAAEPDILFVHGCQFLNMKAVANYSKSHPQVRVYVDNHADYDNSATNWASRRILHGLLWRGLVQALDPYVTRYWGVTVAGCDFLEDVYGLSRDKIALLPLGADFDEATEARRLEIRDNARSRLGLTPSDFVVVTGGKIDKRKRIDHLLLAVRRLDDPTIRVIVFGEIMPDAREDVAEFAHDPNVLFVGWADHSAITEYFLAGDLAVFPGTQSALWPQAIGCGIPCLFRRWKGGSATDMGGNAVFLETGSPEEVAGVLGEVRRSDGVFARLREAAQSDVRRQLWYSEIAKQAIDES